METDKKFVLLMLLGLVALVVTVANKSQPAAPTADRTGYFNDVDWCTDRGYGFISESVALPVVCLDKSGQEVAVPPNSLHLAKLTSN